VKKEMSKRVLLLFVAVTMLASIVAAGCAPDAAPTTPTTPTSPTTPTTPTTPSQPADEVINWVGQAALPAGNPPYEGLVRISEVITAASGGRLVLDANPAGAVVPATEEWKGINSGVLDFCAGGGSYMVSDMRFQTAFSQMPGGMPPLPMMVFHRQEGYKIMNKWYDQKGFKFMDLGGGFHGLPEIWISTNEPLTGPDDLKGMKMRASGDGGKILEGMGVGTVFLPLGELFEAMQRGVIDSFECSCSAFNYSMGLQEAAKYNYLSPSRAPTEIYQFLVDKEKFNALPDDLKVLVEEAAVSEAVKYYVMLNEREATALAEMQAAGNIFETLPASIDSAFVAAAKEFYAEEQEKYPELKDYLASYLAFANSWQQLYGFPDDVMTSLD
jgi:TRAP-type mannitol/chloroaromatic compound transport system substrate-binding protein